LVPAIRGLAVSERPCTQTFSFSVPLLMMVPSNLQQQRPDRVSIDRPNPLSPTVLAPVIASFAPKEHKRIKSPVSRIPDLKLDQERAHARHAGPRVTPRNATIQ
jgi:hypothetical protein